MKKTFFLLFCTISLTSFAQTKTIEIPVAGNANGFQHVAGKGFIFHTQAGAASFSTTTKANVVLMDENMNVVWNKNFKNPLKNVTYNTTLTSPNSEFVYWFYYEKGDLKGKKMSWDGNEQDIEINDIKKKAKVQEEYPSIAFVDKDVLYCVNTNPFKSYRSKHLPTIEMYSIDFKSNTVSNIAAALPARPADSYGWALLGHGDGKIYFKSMNIPEKEDNKVTALIAVIDYSGKLLSSSQFDFDLTPSFPYMVDNSQEFNGTHYAKNHSEEDYQIYNYSSMKLSPDKKSVYLYSLLRDEAGVAKKRTGYVIAKYSIEGTKIWQTIYPFKGAILSDKRIILHGSPHSLNVYFDVNEDQNTVNFHFWEGSEKNTYHVIASTVDGKLIDFFNTNNSTYSYHSYITNSHGKADMIFCQSCVPPEAVPVTSKQYNKELMAFIAQNGELSYVKKAGKNYYAFESSTKKGSDGLKVYFFEGK